MSELVFGKYRVLNRIAAALVVEHGWRGILRFAEVLTGKTVRFDRFEAVGDRRFVFHLSW